MKFGANTMNVISHKPTIQVLSWTIAAPFYQIKEIPYNARHLLAFASNMRLHGVNIYKAMDNNEIANALQFSYQVLMRMKKILKDKKLLFYDGTPGDMTIIRDAYKRTYGKEWEFEL